MASRAKIQDLNHILTSPPSQVLTDDGHFKSRSPKRRDPTITINSSEYRSNDPTLILDGRLPTIASPKSNTNLSKMGASYLAENHNHRRTIFENKTEVDEVVKLPKKPQVETFKEISLPNAPRYDYSSQLLMYIPEDIHSLSAKETAAASGFNSFNQLSQSTKNSHHKLLEGILKQMKPPRSTEIYDQSPTQKQLKSYDNMDSVVKMLQLNKLQKKYYAKQIEVEKKHVVLPLIQQVQENESKTRRMPHVKKLPSRNIFNGNNMDAIIESPAAFERPDFYNSFDRSSFHTLTDIGSGDRRGSKTGSVDETVTNPMFGQVTYKVFWNFNMSDKNTWKPYCREGHTLTAVGRQVILYGGISNCVMGEITVYDPVKNLWSIPQVTGDIPLSGRHGHTACEYRRTLVIFGGEREFNPTLNFRECLNDAYMYIPDKNEWKYMKSSSSLINSRRHHTAAVHESSMYVYGGITNEGNYIKDVWSFNLKTCTWNQLEVEGDKENGIAFHGMSACAISRNGANFRDKERLKAYEEGLYTFGGKDSEGKILSSLKMLPLKTKEHKWKYLAAKGVAPTARYNHSMMFYEPLGIIIIYGGRNDSLFEATRDICLKDIRILNLETLTWTSTSSFGDLPQVGRYHHAVASFGTKMLIFGGVSLQSYANDEVRSVELNPAEVHKLLKEQQALDGVTTTVEYKKPKKNKAVSILKDRTEDEGPHKPMKPSKSVSINTGTMRTWQPIPMPRFGDDDHHVETKSNPNSPNKGGMTKVMRALTKVMPL